MIRFLESADYADSRRFFGKGFTRRRGGAEFAARSFFLRAKFAKFAKGFGKP